MDHSNILGTVLAGGKSQRFGEDKSQAKLGDKLLIDYILSEIIDEFNELLIVSNNSIDFQKSDKISVIKDFKKNSKASLDFLSIFFCVDSSGQRCGERHRQVRDVTLFKLTLI